MSRLFATCALRVLARQRLSDDRIEQVVAPAVGTERFEVYSRRVSSSSSLWVADIAIRITQWFDHAAIQQTTYYEDSKVEVQLVVIVGGPRLKPRATHTSILDEWSVREGAHKLLSARCGLTTTLPMTIF